MEKINILIVEDELLIAEDIRMHLINLGYNVTDVAVSYNEAINSIMQNLPDLVMVDINIDGDKDGIELGAFLRYDVDIPFVYLTSHSDKATVERAKQTNPNAYLLKPFKPENLYTSIEMALSSASENKTLLDEPEEVSEELIIKDSLFVKKDHHFVKLKIDKIKYINSDGNYLQIYKDKSERFIIRSTIKSIIKHLPVELFFQTHKSYIVNLAELDEVAASHVIVDGEEIPLSKNRKDLLFSKMNTFS